MLVSVFEVYNEEEAGCVIFLTKEAALNQQAFRYASVPFAAMVELTVQELLELEALGYLWV